MCMCGCGCGCGCGCVSVCVCAKVMHTAKVLLLVWRGWGIKLDILPATRW